jgi:NAD-dependent protein deacetylase/lipoamidase
MDALLKKAAQVISDSKMTVALTGAGISVESGIPPFRGKGGLWEKFDPMEYAHIQSFLKDPERVWRNFLKEFATDLDTAKPNEGHMALATLEALGKFSTVITQNVDGLHSKAGNTDVIEFHGSFAEHYCMTCNKRATARDLDFSMLPPRCECGGIFRPDCIFFGELIPSDALWRSQKLASTCGVMLVIGTSAVVQPAAELPGIAKHAGAVIIEVNPEETALTHGTSDIFLKGNAGKVLSALVTEVRSIKGTT